MAASFSPSIARCSSLYTSWRIRPSSVHLQAPSHFAFSSKAPLKRSRRTRFWPVLKTVSFAAVVGSAAFSLARLCRSDFLNDHTFTSFPIISKEVVTPTSVILGVSLGANSFPKGCLWSVEFKQPEVQIARHYTPLPVIDDTTLRFYIRAVPGGEMSAYLTRLEEGKLVYLRGPHRSFDLLPRLGAKGAVVFLAGGTGIVPGIQVAQTVLEKDTTSVVSLLWSVRHRNEVQKRGSLPGPWWMFWLRGSAARSIAADLENPSPIAEELVRLKAKYGDRLIVRLAVDAERTQFTRADIQKALNTVTPPAATAAKSHVSNGAGEGCALHDQSRHARASEVDDESGDPCNCISSDGVKPGKNIFLVSGSDGFISHYAGEKIWTCGKLTQGPLAGVAAQLRSRDGSSLQNDWLVLKL